MIMRRKKIGDSVKAMMSFVKLVDSWDFEDYKGWEIMGGIREEGQITWRGLINDLVV